LRVLAAPTACTLGKPIFQRPPFGACSRSGIVGRSTHTIAELEIAAREPVDYVAVGPVFARRRKSPGTNR
jgi:hypothetical protein